MHDVTWEFVRDFYTYSANTIAVGSDVRFNDYFGDVAPNHVKTLTITFKSKVSFTFPERTVSDFYHRCSERWDAVVVGLHHLVFPQATAAHLVEFCEANDYLRSKIQSGVPFCAARLGHAEVMIVEKRDKKAAAMHVGVSPPTDTEMEVFSQAYTRALLASDACLVFDRPYFEHFLDNVYPAIQRCSANVTCEGLHTILFPAAMRYQQFWFHALAGKKVLVVSPLKESIPQQVGKKLFGNDVQYPQFASLEVLETPMTQTMPDDDYQGMPWSQHYARLVQELATKDFDIALLGCGGYALPLAHECKLLGKQAIVIGGVLQLFFGVLGERWVPRIKQFDCQIEWDNWIRPTLNERPPIWKKIENGCYW
jgi:hypothetical protein